MLKFVLAIAGCLLVASVSGAQETSPAEGNEINVGDVMAFQQERHFKLWFAGRAGNWPLADYELGELNEGFEDVSKLLGGDIIEKNVGATMKDLQKIVDDKNAAGFAAAYDRLSAGCNSCHRTLDHAFIAIQRPTVLPYSDQNFAPQK